MAVETDYKVSTVTTTGHTANYDLPLWEGEDYTSWMTQVNDAMNKIDTGIYEAKEATHSVVAIAENAEKLAQETKNESAESAKIVQGYEDRLTAVEGTTAEHTTDLTNLQTRVDKQDTEIHSLKSADEKILTDIGTIQNNLVLVGQNTNANTESIKTNTTEISSLQNVQESMLTDIENLGEQQKALGSIYGKNTIVLLQVNDLINSIDSTCTLQIGGFVVYLYPNGIAQLHMQVANGRSHLIVRRNSTGTTQTLQFNLATYITEIKNKISDTLGKNITLVKLFTEHACVPISNGSASGITPSKGLLKYQFNGNMLLLNLYNMVTGGNEFIDVQLNADYQFDLVDFLFHIEEV